MPKEIELMVDFLDHPDVHSKLEHGGEKGWYYNLQKHAPPFYLFFCLKDIELGFEVLHFIAVEVKVSVLFF